MSGMDLPHIVELPGDPQRFVRLSIDGSDRIYCLEEKNSSFSQACQEWAKSASGEKKILSIVRGSLRGSSYLFKEVNQTVRAAEVADSIDTVSNIFFFASFWADIKIFAKNCSELVDSMAKLVREVSRRFFLQQQNGAGALNDDEEVLHRNLKEMALKAELVLYSGVRFTKDVLKVVQAVLKRALPALKSVLKILSPVLNVWSLRYNVSELLTHRKEVRALEEIEGLESAKRIAEKKIPRGYVEIALDVLDLAMAALGLIALCLLGATPVGLEIALGVVGFLALLISCGNKISGYMAGGVFKEVTDEKQKERIMAVFQQSVGQSDAA